SRFYELVRDVRNCIAKLGGLPPQRSLLFNKVSKRYKNFTQVNKSSGVKYLVFLKLTKTEGVQLTCAVDQIRNAEQEGWKKKLEALRATRELMGTTRFEGRMPTGSGPNDISLRWAYRQKRRYLYGKMLAWQISELQRINFFEDHNLTGGELRVDLSGIESDADTEMFEAVAKTVQLPNRLNGMPEKH
ncbi:MAG: helicase associated domain-containing protein, partial [Colwellia sp.]